MISSKQKVGRELFKSLLEKGRSFHSENFSLRVAPLPSGGLSKFSVVVPKRIEKTAVGRNVTKRLFYRAVGGLIPKVLPGLVCGIFLKKSVKKISFDALLSEVTIVFKKAKII
jgi:ribonuclease P protein component